MSVHLPLTRFFAGLYVYLEQYGLEFVSGEFQIADKPVPEILMEPSLRTQVLVAQVSIIFIYKLGNNSVISCHELTSSVTTKYF